MSGLTSPITTTNMTSIRRKPQFTYQSPSPADLRMEGSGMSSSKALSQKLASASALKSNSISISSPKSIPPPLQKNPSTAVPKRKKYSMGPPLPLYHPFGRLALSLPPLDPLTFGLPTPVRIDDAVRRSSARARRPAAKLRDAEDEPPSPVATVSTNAAVPTREVKEKASPRKKRGGVATGSKRKRKEVDDGDATYPAKRTRNPRGGTGLNSAAEADSPTESIAPPAEITPTPETAVELQEDKKPERRSTRSRGAIKRRDSSASEATSVSVSIGAGLPGAPLLGNAKIGDVMDIDKPSDAEEPRKISDDREEEKEDGEVSEEGQDNS